MGRIDVTVNVASPSDRSQTVETLLMVDTGATFTVLPPEVWQRIGVEAEFIRRLRTADGRVLERPQGLAYLQIDDAEGTVPVIEGGDGDIPVLGVTTLEILALAVDPVRGEFRPSEHLYL